MRTWTVTEMAALFGVSACAYYRWAKHGVSLRRQAEDAELLGLIRGIVERDMELMNLIAKGYTMEDLRKELEAKV